MPSSLRLLVGIAAAIAAPIACASANAPHVEPPVASSASTSAAASSPPPSSTGTATAAIKCPAGMAAIPGGAFTLFVRGDHVVVEPFCLDVTEVTVDAYGLCVAAEKCPDPKTSAGEDPYDASNAQAKWRSMCNWNHPEGRRDHPMNCIHWYGADGYCDAQKKRLPTEAEWEWAAAGESGSRYPWGDDAPSADRVNACGKECPANGKKKLGVEWKAMYSADDGYAETSPVGSFAKGDDRWGVHDLAGNVREWTREAWGSSSKEKVLRGGSFGDGDEAAIAAPTRTHEDAMDRGPMIGFRCAADPLR